MYTMCIHILSGGYNYSEMEGLRKKLVNSFR